MPFPPGPEQPTAPNAGILRLESGAHHPEHDHGFAQVWFILKGEFTIDERLCPPGTMLDHPDLVSSVRRSILLWLPIGGFTNGSIRSRWLGRNTDS
jgi:hypothetical protein